MKLRRIKAVFSKQIMDITHNTGILMQFLLYPILMLVMVFALPSDSVAAKMGIVMSLSTMFTGMMPILTINNIIREDKYTNTLRMLIMSTVKPPEYLIGITAYILFISLITSFIFGLIGGFGGLALLCFTGVLMAGIVTTLLLGSAMAIQSANRSNAGNLITIISLMNGLIPVLGAFNPSILKIAKFWYTTQIRDLIGDLYDNYYENLWYRFLIIGVNFTVFLILFTISYKKNKFYGEK